MSQISSAIEQSPLRYRAFDQILRLGLLPDAGLRLGTRIAIRRRERREARGGVEGQETRLRELLEWMSNGPIAEATEAANEQHYEQPGDLIGLLLGPRRKYSACLFEGPKATLAEAEDAMLALTCSRAALSDGQRILELGCGWGSLTLWMAERYPGAEIVAVSNSTSQRRHVEARAETAGLDNVTVITSDINEFEPPIGGFDRVVSVEMLEHLRNWRALLERISSWLRGDGMAFVHVFSHRTLAYRFVDSWFAERWFTGGLMPSHDLLLRFDEHLRVSDRWAISGTHYARTLGAWLAQLDARRKAALAILRDAGYSAAGAQEALASWRMFLIAAEESWRHRAGNRWMVSHYLLERR